MEDLDLLTIGLVLDIWTEKGNDKSGGYRQIAQQSDFDAFSRKKPLKRNAWAGSFSRSQHAWR